MQLIPDFGPRISHWLQLVLFVFVALGFHSDVKAAALSGNYSIGVGGDYSDFTSAVAAVSLDGVSGPVVFAVDGGVYYEQFEIGSISGASAVNTITFQPATSDSVKIEFRPTSTEAYVVRFGAARHVIFDGLHLRSNLDQGGLYNKHYEVVEFSGEVVGVQLLNGSLTGVVYDHQDHYKKTNYAVCYASDLALLRDVVIQGNDFISGGYQILFTGLDGNEHQGTRVIGNTFTGTNYRAIQVSESDDLLIANNFINSNSYTGSYVYNQYGIYVKNALRASVYHNSFDVTLGVGSSYNDRYGAALVVSGETGDDIEILNNIVVHANDGIALWVVNPAAVIACDYNDLVTNGQNLVRWGTTNYLDFQSYQVGSGFGQNSVNVAPGYSSLNEGDLHIEAPFFDGVGTSGLRVLVDTDIDGETRSALSPVDIGADAYDSTIIPFSGMYTIGSGRDYEDFLSAVVGVSAAGVSGPVVFAVDSGVYYEQFEIGSISGASAVNTITFQPATSDSVKIEFRPTATESYVVRFGAARHVIFDGLHLRSNLDQGGLYNKHYEVVEFSGEVVGVQLLNGSLTGVIYDSSNYYTEVAYAVCYATDSALLRDVVIQGNDFISGGYQILFTGLDGNEHQGTRIIGNTFTGTNYRAIQISESDDLLIANNFVSSSLYTSGSFYKQYGIYVKNALRASVYHNSFDMTLGEGRSYSDQYGAALVVSGETGDDIEILNNIVVHANDGIALWVVNPAAVSACNYNDLVTNGQNLVRWGATNYLDFQSYQVGSGFGLNSFAVDPGYNNDYSGDLHTLIEFFNGSGTLALREPVPYDIDNDLRSGLSPVDVGADAFQGAGANGPVIASNLSSLDFGLLFASQAETLFVDISNLGAEDLTISSVVTGTTIFSVPATSVLLVPGASTTLPVIFQPIAEQAYVDTVFINSNDPGNPVYSISVQGEGYTTPDLVISSVNVMSSTNFDSSIQVQWQVNNFGNEGTGGQGWYDQVFLSTSPDITIGSPISLTTVQNQASLTALGDVGDGYINNVNVLIPRGLAGSYYIIVETDTHGSLAEIDEDNNGHNIGQPIELTIPPLPDLHLTNIVAPLSIFSLDTVVVEWTVQNLGTAPTEVGEWTDSLFLSDNDTLDIAFNPWSPTGIHVVETHIGSNLHNGVLAPGEFYTGTTSFVLPQTTQGDFFLFVFADFRVSGIFTNSDQDGEVYEFDKALDESNWANVPLTVTMVPPPDLQVQAISGTAIVVAGDLIDIACTVKNFGAGDTQQLSWYDKFYLSPSPALDTETAFYLGNAAHVGLVEPDSSYTVNLSFETWNQLEGDYFLFAITDAGSSVYEYDQEGNNVSTAFGPISITLEAPDLFVESISIPASGQSGDVISVSWTVNNQGEGATYESPWYDRVYLTQLSVFDVDEAVLLGSNSHIQPVDVDSTYTVTKDFFLPEGASGNYSIFVHVDYDGSLFEAGRISNNLGQSISLPVMLSPWADLQVTAVQYPVESVAGSVLAVSWSVENQGTADADAISWTDHIFLVQGVDWNPQIAQLLGTYTRNENLSIAAQYDISQQVTLPTDLSGQYTFFVYADRDSTLYEHTDENNNIHKGDTIFIDGYPPIDLAVTNLVVPLSAGSGETISVSWAVENNGTVQTLANRWNDSVYLSTDAVFENNVDLLLLSLPRLSALDADQSYSRDIEVEIPNGLFGEYYIFIQNDLIDSDVSNNTVRSISSLTVTQTPAPDLIVASINTPVGGNAGQPMEIEWEIGNQGLGATIVPNWIDEIYLSVDMVIGDGDIKLGSYSHTGILAAGATITQSKVVDLPRAMEGPHYLLIKTDTRDIQYEDGLESNNLGTKAFVLTLPPPGDLIVTDILIPVTAVPGEDIVVTWVIQNIGINPVVGQMSEAVYVSQDSLFQVDDPLIGVNLRTIDLAPQESMLMKMTTTMSKSLRLEMDGSITDELPGIVPGDYHVIVRTDVRDNFPETDDSNNLLVSDTKIGSAMPLLVANQAMNIQMTSESNYYFELPASPGFDFRLNVSGLPYGNNTAILVSYESAPSAVEYEFKNTDAFGVSHEILLPAIDSGSYFLSLNTSGMDAPSIVILAEELSFAIESVYPLVGGTGGKVTGVVRGAQFAQDIEVMLVDGEGLEFAAESIEFVDSTNLIVKWDLVHSTLGQYTVRVRAIGGDFRDFGQGFIIVVPTLDSLEMTLSHTQIVRPGRFARQFVQIRNIGVNDIDFGLLNVVVPANVSVNIESSDFHGPLVENDGFSVVELDTISDIDSGLWLGDVGVVEGVAMNIGVGETVSAVVTLQTAANIGGNIPFWIGANGFSEDEFVGHRLLGALKLRDVILNGDLQEDRELWHTLVDSDEGYRALMEEIEYYLDYSNRPSEFVEFRMAYTAVEAGVSKCGGQSSSRVNSECLQFLNAAVYSEKVLFGGIGLSKGIVSNSLFKKVSGAYGLGSATYTYAQNNALICSTAGTYDPGEMRGLFSGWKTTDFVEIGLTAVNIGKLAGGFNPVSVTWLVAHIGAKYYPVQLCEFFTILDSYDPNEIIGPVGFGDERWIALNEKIPYQISFENSADQATAPAQSVLVTQSLDLGLSPEDFRLGSFGFAGFTFTVPEGSSTYTGRLDVSDSLGLWVDVTAGLDVVNNSVFWNFRSIDPSTGQPPTDPLAGFLAINDTLTGSGEGFVTYTIKPGSGLVYAEQIDASASIVFDSNEPITTQPTFNTVDTVIPGSVVLDEFEFVDGAAFFVKWYGIDFGSGVHSYDLYVSENDGPFTLHQAGITETSLVFNGSPMNKYSFFTQAVDNAGNVEVLKASPDAEIQLGVSAVPSLPQKFDLMQNYPNPFNPVTTIRYALPRAAKVELDIYNVRGQKVRSLVSEYQEAGYQRVVWDGRDNRNAGVGSGVYFYRIRAGGFVKSRKLLLLK